MQKTKRFQLLTVLLAVVMMFALSIQAYAATSKPVTQDGITATLVTDKDSYKAGESVNATVKIENNSGQDVFVFTQITVPSTVKLTGANAFDAVLANGQAWTSAAGVLSGTAGTTATGDRLQAGLWTVVSILATCGVAALLVYGKNRKTWVSMMLCVVMIGGLMAAAVPAQAAGVSGSMSVSCAIQVDGKAAEVTAVVNYIVGYEAGSVTTTTTPSETPSVAPTTVPSEDPTTVPTEDPTEAPTTVPTEDPTEAPTETPTEAPTTAPTEDPTEAPTTVPSEEPTVAPTAVPTEEPVEDEVPSENGYYVVWDDFNFCEINSYTDGMFTSWDVVQPQGAPNKAGDGASFVDASEYAGAQARRAFNAIADDFTMEFTMRMSAGMEDTVIDLRNEDTTAIRFTVEGDKLFVDGEELCALPVDVLKTFTLHISPANGTYTISVDGTTVMDGDAAKEFTFENSTDAIDRLYIETGVEEMGQVVIGTVRVYVDFYVNEKFLDGTNLAINDEWTITGDAATIYKKGTQGPDKYNAQLSDGDSISRDVAYEQDGAWVEFQQLMEENVGEFVMTLADDAGNTFKVATKDGKFGYYNGTEFVGLYDCVANLWYHVMIKQTDAGTELYLNHKLKADELPNIKFTKMTFGAIGGEAMLDDIVVKDWIPLPEDYVPAPVAVEKEEGAILVGLQSCNLWVEGEHFGYDWLTDWEERTTILGYYDEISVESADWELKFKIEHGIDFELYCWYRTTDGQNEPIKMPRNSRALHEGYMNAEYSDQMKFAITWESGSGGKDLADFKEHIVPYWIEQYFKDDRYLVIDNKPLIGMYNIDKLKSYFGGTIAGVKEAMDYLRQACVDAGFDGAYIIMCNRNASTAQEIAQASFDGQYAYTWGSSGHLVATQTKGMEGMQTMLEAGGYRTSGVVPTVSQGFWDKAWDRNDGNYASVETFQTVLEWVRDDFIPSLDQNSIGSKMVLVDNWNEYGEGHFIMPANLAGFGYVDAIKTVFGDGEACDEDVQHLEPTQAQLDRIQHMYIQDRHVVLVDKGEAASDVVPMTGYNWTFETAGDTEGWTVGINDGKWIKALSDWAVKDGNFWGVTFTPEELSAKVTSGELPSGATADPSLMSPDNLGLPASQAIAIKIRMKGECGVEAIGKPAIYFITEEDQKWSGGKMVDAFYEETADGFVDITFNMTTNTLWTGTIKQIRFDPIERDGEFWVDSIQILKRVENGDAEIYKDGERIYTALPVETVDGEYMFPLNELESILDCYTIEPLEKDRLYIYTETAFYEFPYEGETKLFVNGVAVDSVGAVTLNDTLYVPFIDIFENIGTVTNALGETHPAYTVTVTPATASAKTKIEIEKYVDPTILKGYYFSTSTDGWTYGGKNITKVPAVNGVGAIESTANGADTKFWSPESKQFDVNAQKVDHIRMRVTTDAATENPTFKMIVYGDGTTYSYTYNITLTEDMLDDDGFYTVTINLADAQASSLKPAKELDRVCIYWYDATAGGVQTFAMDSFELLDLVEDNIPDEDPEEAGKVVIEESPYTIYDWDFTESKSGWTKGGLTGCDYDDKLEALKVTCNPHGTTYRMDVWSSTYDETKKEFANPLNISAADATHVLIRIQTEEEVDAMALTLQYVNEDGSLGSSVGYEAEYITDVNGDLYALVDLTSNTAYDTTKTIGRFNVFPIGKTVGEADNGKVVYITSVEVLDKNWYIEFDSAYFTNGREGWIKGGYTVLNDTDEALEVLPPTTAGDYNPRIWSLKESGGVVNDAYKYTKDDVTHVRVRLKAVVPKTLPDTMTDDEKAVLAGITSEDLRLVLEFTDGTRAYVPSRSYNIGTEDYETVTFDVSSDIWPEGKKLARIGLEMFEGGNEYLCKAGAAILIDSVQFLRRTSEDDESQALKVLIIGNSITQHAPNLSYGWAADWGMAATSADKDYVHLLEDSILAKNGAVEVKAVNIAEYEKYFYDWSLISDTKDKYANWNADIIIATFGANVKNGANENDSSYENDYVFSPAKYKKIIDKFNPDGDATVIAGATVLTREQIVKNIKDAAAEYGYTYVDMTEWTADEYKAYDYEDEILAYYYEVTGDTSKTEVYAGVLSHPGDLGMAKIAEELWTALDSMIPQGIPAEEEDPDDGGEDDEEESDILKAFYFTDSKEFWESGGLSSQWQEDGTFLMDFTGQTNTGAGWKSPTGAANLLKLDPSQVGSVVITVQVADGVIPDTAELQCFSGSHSGSLLSVTAKYELVEGNTYTVTFDTTKLGLSAAEGVQLNSVRINGMKVRGEATQGKYYLDSVEFIRIDEEDKVEVVTGDDAGKWAEGDATYASLIKGWYFNEASEAWKLGGAGTNVSCNNGAFVVSGGGTAVSAAWTSYTENEGVISSQTGEVIKATETDTLRIRVKSEAETSDLAVTVTYYNDTTKINKSFKADQITWTTDDAGWYIGVIDLSADNECYAEGYSIGRLGCNPNGQSTDIAKTGTAYIDYIELLKKAEVPVTPEEPEVPTEKAYAVTKGWYLDANAESWQPGGAPTSHGYDTAKTAYKLETKVGSVAALKGPVVTSSAFTLEDFDTIRIQLTSGTPNAVFSFTTFFANAAGSTICTVDTRQVTLDAKGNATILVDCSNATLGSAGVLEALRINVSSSGVNTCYIDSVELLKTVDAPTTQVLHAWDFVENTTGWVGGGSTGAVHNADKEALQVTVKSQRGNVWSAQNSDNDVINPLNISAAEATTVVVRVESEADLSVMGLEVQFVDENGTSTGIVTYKNILYTEDENGELYAVVDLNSRAGYDTTKTIGRINIYPIGHTITEADNDKVIYITSAEILGNE